MNTRHILAWHFLAADRRLRYDDSRIVQAGETYSVPDIDHHLALCEYGMHASVCPLDALNYAPGPIVCRVALSGRIEHDNDKLYAQHRRVLWMADATETLREYARWCALRVAHLWDCPAIVLEYLETGDESKRTAARTTAGDARAAARAARTTAGDARATGAAWAAWAAAWAAGDAAMTTARATAMTTARATAWDAARAARAATRAARTAGDAWDAGAAERKAQAVYLTSQLWALETT